MRCAIFGMPDFYKRRKLLRYAYSRGTIAVLLVLLSFFGYVAYGAYSKSAEARDRKDEVARELEKLHEREATLKADIEALNSERGAEAALRERYQVGREGEEVLVLLTQESEEVPGVVPVEPPGFWKRLFAIVF